LSYVEKFMLIFCSCFNWGKEPPTDPDEEEPETGNVKIVDMLIFSESNPIYNVWNFVICFMCMFSCYYYLYCTAGRFYLAIDDIDLIWGFEPYIFATVCIEFSFFIDMVLQFFKEYTPVG
jgi:hypothetical protein